MMVAVKPARVPTLDSLELWVWLNSDRSNNSTPPAMANPPSTESGALMIGGLVAGNCERIMPKPPKAVTKEAMMVGLSTETPGMSLLSTPASA